MIILVKLNFLVFCFNKDGIPPIINPIIQKQVCIWKESKRNFSIFPNNIIPTKTPIIIGSKKDRFFL